MNCLYTDLEIFVCYIPGKIDTLETWDLMKNEIVTKTVNFIR